MLRWFLRALLAVLLALYFLIAYWLGGGWDAVIALLMALAVGGAIGKATQWQKARRDRATP